MNYIPWVGDAMTRCINLLSRNDKRVWMKKQLKKKNINCRFHVVKKHRNPKRGCLESHLTCIREALEKGADYLLMLEDYAKFNGDLDSFPKPPSNWEMLYLGGTIRELLDSKDNNDDWQRMRCWTTHAYIINLKNKKFVEDLLKLDEYEEEIDKYFVQVLHSKYRAFMIKPMLAVQKDGFSDIENRYVNYDFMAGTLSGLRRPDSEVDGDGNYVLKLDNIPFNKLPNVSIVTPTFERRHVFQMALQNFFSFAYPPEKLEWVIVDDSLDREKSIEDILPNDPRIKYIYLEPEDGVNYTVAYKRNVGCERAKNDIICHMDDDDYYPAESILARVKVLLKYPEIGMVGCSKIGNYNIMNKVSSFSSDGMISISEASMAYYKRFWKQKPFNPLDKKGEFGYFIHGRLDQIMDIPYSFVLIALTHTTNITNLLDDGEARGKKSKTNLIDKSTNRTFDFYSTFDEDTQHLIDNIRRHLKTKAKATYVEKCIVNNA